MNTNTQVFKQMQTEEIICYINWCKGFEFLSRAERLEMLSAARIELVRRFDIIPYPRNTL